MPPWSGATPRAAIAPLEAFGKVWRRDPNLKNFYIDNPCFLGLAYGLCRGAWRTLKPSSRTRALVALLRLPWRRAGPRGRCGRRAACRAEGLKLAPDLPMIYLHRGQFELDHGDLKARGGRPLHRHAKAPHFADPLKAWGDLLAREGRWKAALAKYDEALKYAPAWAELHRGSRRGGAGIGADVPKGGSPPSSVGETVRSWAPVMAQGDEVRFLDPGSRQHTTRSGRNIKLRHPGRRERSDRRSGTQPPGAGRIFLKTQGKARCGWVPDLRALRALRPG